MINTAWEYHYFTRGTRYYRLTVMQDLFGQWIVLREWGSIPRRTMRWIAMPAASYQDAQQLLASLIERRLKRHYSEITSTDRNRENTEPIPRRA